MPDYGYFHNASLLVERPQGDRTAAGYEQTGTETLLQCRCDAQESGRSLERAQQLHETGDVPAFAEESVTDVEPGDEGTIDLDEGRTLSGSAEEIVEADDSLLITL